MIWALAAAFLDGMAALLHLLIIVKGAEWYRFFGAGEEMARMKEAGSLYPDLITVAIACVLFVWGLYALQSAGLRWPFALPWLKQVLLLITLVFALRGLLPFLAMPFIPALNTSFMVWSSLICCLYALLHFLCWWKA